MDIGTFSGFFLLLSLLGSGGGIDIVSLIPTKEYFGVRAIEPTIDKLVELAGEAPTTGKKLASQLFALRQLAADAESVKKSPKASEIRQLLQQIADGKKANDSTGFAADYAKRALVALDGGKAETPAVPNWKEGAAWIPGHVTLLAALDAHGSKPGESRLPDLTPFFSKKSKKEKEELFDVIDKVGNARIDRIVVGLCQVEKNIEFFVRITGKVNSAWLSEGYEAGLIEERANGSGPKIRVIRPLCGNGKGPAMALVGDSDFLVAGAEPIVRLLGNDLDVAPAEVKTLDKMLALVAKPGANATQGVLKADLAQVPTSAGALAVGTLPPSEFKGAPFEVPQKLIAHAQRTANGIDVQIQATMAGGDGAKKLVETIGTARDTVVAQLGNLAQPTPGLDLKSIITMLKGIQLQSEGAGVQIRLHVPADFIKSIPGLPGLAPR